MAKKKKKKVEKSEVNNPEPICFILFLCLLEQSPGKLRKLQKKRNNVQVEAAGSCKWTLEGEEGKEKRD